MDGWSVDRRIYYKLHICVICLDMHCLTENAQMQMIKNAIIYAQHFCSI
jgi:hypothetical protein